MSFHSVLIVRFLRTGSSSLQISPAVSARTICLPGIFKRSESFVHVRRTLKLHKVSRQRLMTHVIVFSVLITSSA